jgi:hypothetical protein
MIAERGGAAFPVALLKPAMPPPPRQKQHWAGGISRISGSIAQHRQRILDGELQALAVDPALVLAGARPRLLDEWQVAPALWNLVRRRWMRPASPASSCSPGLDASPSCASGR